MNVYKIKNSKLDDKTVIANDMSTALDMYYSYLDSFASDKGEEQDLTEPEKTDWIINYENSLINAILSCTFIKKYDDDIIM